MRTMRRALIDEAGQFVNGCDHWPLENADEAEYFTERAGVYEFEAGNPRHQAEVLAMRDVMGRR